MGLTIDDVWYSIDSDTDVPEIYIRDEKALVITCSTHWVTRQFIPTHKTKIMTATIILQSEVTGEDEPKQHVISIDTHLGKVFYQ
ncbi:hypothetical protein ACEN4E_05560 [Latilactobacillus sakei]|uniref:hypothetical protein n=1 Tax=Latilactobacillus sakei TaxID=1599 RepID=UPI0038872A58